jgi:lipoate-protein ligase A
MRPCYYLETASHDPFYNLAFEEYVLTHKTEGDYLILWQNENTIVVGQNQNTEEEINRPFVESHHINVVRRMTGGGAVYHDLGNLNYSFITDAGEVSQLSINRFTAPVVHALGELGLHAEASGRNDILVDGKKVSGTAQRYGRTGSYIMGHCCSILTQPWWAAHC